MFLAVGIVFWILITCFNNFLETFTRKEIIHKKKHQNEKPNKEVIRDLHYNKTFEI